MTLEQIEAVLAVALPLRVPRFELNTNPRMKADRLQDFMLTSALANGDLVQGVHYLRLLEDRLSERWDHLEGWEVATTKPRAKLTTADIDRAKAQVEPTLHDARHKARRLRESIVEQITRLERDERICSRVYSMLAG